MADLHASPGEQSREEQPYLVVGHVFWQLLKNRSQLMAMVSGRIAADTFSANHDWDRWKPDAVLQTADAGKVDHGE